MAATKLLTFANAKTPKGEALGYLTGILYFAPYDLSGHMVCAFADVAKCHGPCLNLAGRGAFSATQEARIRKTRWFFEDRDAFMRQLVWDVEAVQRKADRLGLRPVVRLNGTSDVVWERFECVRGHIVAPNIFAAFPEMQFYDYTKIVKRLYEPIEPNYHLTLSYSEASRMFARRVWKTHADTDCGVAIVVRDDVVKQKWIDCPVFHTVDGDLNDLRFLDDPASIVLLKAKGPARRDQSGFVLDGLATVNT